MTTAEHDHTPGAATNEPPEVEVLSAPSEGIPDVIADDRSLAAAAEAIGAGDGPIAIDAERASGHRYGQRAYLVQVRREGTGTFLIDPIAISDTAPLARALSGGEWILHAATQDLPCLRELDLTPSSLFDTELAGRLLGLPRVGLAGLVEDVLGVGLAKGHGAADWSRRPLPAAWLSYAALDVELLVELREDLIERLRRTDRLDWARQEFDALLDWQPRAHQDPWRRTKGVNRLRTPRQMAAARELWLTRDRIAQRADQPAPRILPDAALVAAAQTMPKSEHQLRAMPEFARQRRSLGSWWAALQRAAEAPESELPPLRLAEEIPPHRNWPNRRPEAAQALSAVRAALNERADSLGVAHEVLINPDAVRTVVWRRTGQSPVASQIAADLAAAGARPWQVELTAEVIAGAVGSAGTGTEGATRTSGGQPAADAGESE